MARQGLDRSAILGAALALADREGLDALTMRALGAELGVEAPSLYRHVHGKEDILDALCDLIYSSVEFGRIDAPWQDRIRSYANELRSGLLAHPNLAPLVATRPVFSASTLGLVEQALAELTDVGFSSTDAGLVVNNLVSFVIGEVLSELSFRQTGTDPEALASVRSMLPEEEFPNVRAVLGAGPGDRTEQFEFGLSTFITGLDAHLAGSGATE